MEDYIRQLLTQELQSEDSGEVGNPTISPESKAGVGIASLINAIVGAKAMKGSGNAGLGALYGGASTYGEGMGNLQKSAAQAQTNRSKEERFKYLIEKDIRKGNIDTVRFLEERKLKEDKAKKDAEDRDNKNMAAQAYGMLNNLDEYTQDGTPERKEQARRAILERLTGLDSGMAQKHLQNTKETREDLSINRIIKDSMEVDSQTGKPTPRAVDARRVLGGIEQHKQKTERRDPFTKYLKTEGLRQSWNNQINSLQTKDPFNGEFYESIREKGLDLIDEGKSPQKLFVKPKEEVSDKTKQDWVRRAKSDSRNKGITDEQLSDWYDKNKRK